MLKKLLIIFISSLSLGSEGPVTNPELNSKKDQKIIYSIKEREHTTKEVLTDVAAIYAISWPLYIATQYDTIEDNGSWTNFKNNLGTIVFDKDEPIWNWVGHPISGSQMYLYYRANGYSKIDSFELTFISSALFEFLVEIYTEPASIQDLYQTPVLGTLGGMILEEASMYLLNTEYKIARILGHILNPSTLFWFYEGKVVISPSVDDKKLGLNLYLDF